MSKIKVTDEQLDDLISCEFCDLETCVFEDRGLYDALLEFKQLRKDSAEQEAKQLHDIAMLVADRAELRKENIKLMDKYVIEHDLKNDWIGHHAELSEENAKLKKLNQWLIKTEMGDKSSVIIKLHNENATLQDQNAKLVEIANELIDKYDNAEDGVICERSTNHDADSKELDLEVLDYRKKIAALMEELERKNETDNYRKSA